MASGRRRKSLPIEEILVEQAVQFEFHAFIKILEELNPQGVPLGVGEDPLTDIVNFKTYVGFDFPATDIRSFQLSDGDMPPQLTVDFFGIAGHPGPLPTPYTQILLDNDRRGDTAFHFFLDIFNHRFISILQRIRKKYWVGLATDVPENTMLGQCLASLLGLGIPLLKGRMTIPDRSLFPYIGLLWGAPRSRVSLQKILSSFFRLPISIDECQGKWVPVPLSQRSALGKSGRFNGLGKDAILGGRFWDQKGLFTIHLGPMKLSQYMSFLKPGKSYDALCDLVGYYMGKSSDFRINLILDLQEIPKTALGTGAALSWTSWLNRGGIKPLKDDDQNTMTTAPYFSNPTALKKTLKGKKASPK
jgi:type VI secretion system protein ImpH